MAGDEVVYKILWGKSYFDIGGSITLHSYFGMRAKSLALWTFALQFALLMYMGYVKICSGWHIEWIHG